LLDRIIKSDRLTGGNALKPYCFPDISIGCSPDTIECGEGDGFQRIDFVKLNKPASVPFPSHSPLPSDVPKVSGENGKPVDNIKQKAQDIEKEAYIKGFAKGEKDGMKSGENKFKSVLNNFRQAFLELEKMQKEMYLDAEKKTVSLALSIARKVVCHEIAANKEVVLNVVKEAAKKVVNRGKIIIKTSPSDFQFVKNFDHDFLSFIDNIENVTFEGDKTISDGGCIIENDFGDIDARIEKQFQVVDEAFKCEGLIRGVISEKRKTVSR